MNSNYLAPLASCFTLLFLEIFFFYPKTIYFCLFFIILFLFLFVIKACGLKKLKKPLNYAILPIILTVGIIIYSTMATSGIFIQALFFVNFVFIFLYFKAILGASAKIKSEIKELNKDKELEKNFSDLENISIYGNFLAFFFFTTAIYGLSSHLSVPILFSLGVISIISILLIYSFFFSALEIGKNNNFANLEFLNFSKKKFIYLAICSFALIELGVVVAFLPFSYNVIGLILAILYYIFLGLARHYFQDKLDSKSLRLYLGFGFAAIILILVSSKWL